MDTTIIAIGIIMKNIKIGLSLCEYRIDSSIENGINRYQIVKIAYFNFCLILNIIFFVSKS
jgi:hypothetical protein